MRLRRRPLRLSIVSCWKRAVVANSKVELAWRKRYDDDDSCESSTLSKVAYEYLTSCHQAPQ
jgi:hypothetical protein